jgi:hypothetical protein
VQARGRTAGHATKRREYVLSHAYASISLAETPFLFLMHYKFSKRVPLSPLAASPSLREHFNENFQYGDVGRVAVGAWGARLVDIALVFTQYGFCAAYLIFLGNTIHDLGVDIGLQVGSLANPAPHDVE